MESSAPFPVAIPADLSKVNSWQADALSDERRVPRPTSRAYGPFTVSYLSGPREPEGSRMSANRGLRRARFTMICAAAASLTLAFSPGAHAAQLTSQHKVTMPQAGSVKPFAPLANLVWGGGPVEHGTKVYL